MNRARMLIAAAALAGLAPAGAASRKLPPYPYALRCATLTQAWAEQDRSATKEGRRRFDAALFWGLAASEAARKAKLSGAAFTADEEKGAREAAAQLAAKDPGALAALARCVAEVPPLTKARKRRGPA